ncbi:MAG: hypothetical protein JWQ98_2510 [Chlorobi bacterium]|nr:hypothetical protein [Chlorobiota bacterium]
MNVPRYAEAPTPFFPLLGDHHKIPQTSGTCNAQAEMKPPLRDRNEARGQMRDDSGELTGRIVRKDRNFPAEPHQPILRAGPAPSLPPMIFIRT